MAALKKEDSSMQKLIEQLKRHEGYRRMPYDDATGKQVLPGQKAKGKLTIGYGRNIEDVPLSARELSVITASSQEELLANGISEADAEALLILEVQRLHAELGRQIAWFKELDIVRQAVLINMAFNLGITGLLKFKNTMALIKQGLASGDYGPGADAMMTGNKWYLQVGDGPGGRFDRAEELSEQMRTGEWQGVGTI